MEINSIKKIRSLRDGIREKIKTADREKFENEKFGSENEYSYKIILKALEEFISDLSVLTKYPSKFIRISTFNERKKIIQHLNNLIVHLDGNPNNIVNDFEHLKVMIRNYNVRARNEKEIDFEEEIQKTRDKKQDLDQLIKNSSDIEDVLNNLKENYEESKKLNRDLNDSIEKNKQDSQSLKNINNELNNINQNANQYLQKITNILSNAKSNLTTLNSFVDEVDEKSKKLKELESKINKYYDTLESFKQEQKNLLEEANDLISSAKKALNYKTAEGISASFQTQYENAKNKWVLYGWLAGSVVCLIVTIFLGLWILEDDVSELGLLIGRISLMPLPIIGAIFCAKQYVKQKNIIEDYAYKMVLAKSIVGFSEQLKKNEKDSDEYEDYIKTVLKEIHRDPLRKRDEKVTNNKKYDLDEILKFSEKIRHLGNNE